MSPRVLFTASTYSHIRNFHFPYLAEFRRLGWTVDVGCGGSFVDFPEADLVIKLPFKKKIFAISNFKAMGILRRTVRENDYDLICTHTSLAAFFTRLALRTNPNSPPLVTVVHGYLFGKKPKGVNETLLLLAEKLVAHRTDLLLTMNKEDFISATEKKLCKKIAKIPGIGVSFSLQDQASVDEAQQLRQSLKHKDSDILILCAAEFSSRKNQTMLLHALPQLSERVRLILPGEGILLGRCQSLAKELGVAQRVMFPGQVDNMPIWYSAVDLAVSASSSEGLPFSIMEAMYAGLPIVASRVKGHVDLIDEGRNGLLYTYDDIPSFIEQIMLLINNPELARKIGNEARKQLAPYSIEGVLPRVMDLYLSAVNQGEDKYESSS